MLKQSDCRRPSISLALALALVSVFVGCRDQSGQDWTKNNADLCASELRGKSPCLGIDMLVTESLTGGRKGYRSRRVTIVSCGIRSEFACLRPCCRHFVLYSVSPLKLGNRTGKK